MDTSKEHYILKGEPFLIGTWISFVQEKKKMVQFKEAKGVESALIHVAEVFSTDIVLNDSLQTTYFICFNTFVFTLLVHLFVSLLY